jgi:glycosyltransferase involved in cell wall biosynthesis
MIAVSHPTGNEFVRALLAALEKKQLLARFFTTLNAPPENLLRLLPEPLRGQIARREFAIPRSKITARPAREIVRLFASAAGITALRRHESGAASLDAVYRDLDRFVAAWIHKNGRAIRAVHCYEDGALETFRVAAQRGLKRSYELPIAYWETSRKILGEEAQRLPAWEPTLFATRDSTEKCERKTQELLLADTVICPSRFVLESLPENVRREKKCTVAKFGSPPAQPHKQRVRADGRLRVLFAGSMSQRKGLADVFAAMKLLGRTDAELVVLGSAILPMRFYREQFGGFIYEPPRPHAAVLALMQTCDVLVLPSLVEGRALVQQEALACGLPLVVTANAGADDLIDEGSTGFLVPIRAPEKIAEKIAWFASHREQLPAMAEASQARAATCSWEGYADTIIRATGLET